MGSIARSLQTVHDSAWFGRIARAGYYAVRPFFVARHLIERADVAILPPEEKHAFILRTAQSLRCRYFVETGTYRGATAAYMSQHFARCYTVELDQALAARAAQLLPQFGDIRVYQGHSTAQLPKIMADLDDRALFWLDAHGNTLPKTPVLRELEIVLEDHRFDHVIMVDDARAFLGINSYPTISRVRKTVARVAPEYKIRCINDIIIVRRCRCNARAREYFQIMTSQRRIDVVWAGSITESSSNETVVAGTRRRVTRLPATACVPRTTSSALSQLPQGGDANR